MPPVTTESALPDEVAIATQSCAVQSSWHLQFNIPELGTFSGAVKKAVKTGIVTSVARREIVQVLRTYMTQHTRKPTSEQYITVCQKLIGKLPNLKDTEGDSPFVTNVFLLGFMLNVYFQASWRLSLRNSFKNFRRKGSDCHHDEPPSKRMKFHLKDLPEITEEEYEEAIENLNAELKKGGKRMGKHSAVKHLMKLTRAKQCQWVQQDCPLILEVVEKFPCLAFSK